MQRKQGTLRLKGLSGSCSPSLQPNAKLFISLSFLNCSLKLVSLILNNLCNLISSEVFPDIQFESFLLKIKTIYVSPCKNGTWSTTFLQILPIDLFEILWHISFSKQISPNCIPNFFHTMFSAPTCSLVSSRHLLIDVWLCWVPRTVHSIQLKSL